MFNFYLILTLNLCVKSQLKHVLASYGVSSGFKFRLQFQYIFVVTRRQRKMVQNIRQ